jgi:hypothetical protein
MEALPKKYKRVEMNYTPLVMDWFLENYPYDVCVELKIGDKEPKPHQQAALESIAKGNFKYKIPDMGRKNPFDFMVFHVKAVHAIWAQYYPEDKKLWFKDLTNDSEYLEYL